MDGLNHGVITGKCSGCMAYWEKIARLEERNTVLAAALRGRLSGPWTVPEGFKKCGECRANIELDGHGADCPWLILDAVLKDTGEGWLRGLPFSSLVSAWVKAQPEMVAGIREGVQAMKEGRVTPWEDVERELFGGKGWLEVREQAREAIEWVMKRVTPAGDGTGAWRIPRTSLERLGATLDAPEAPVEAQEEGDGD